MLDSVEGARPGRRGQCLWRDGPVSESGSWSHGDFYGSCLKVNEGGRGAGFLPGRESSVLLGPPQVRRTGLT